MTGDGGLEGAVVVLKTDVSAFESFVEGWRGYTWEIWESGFAAGEGCAGWSSDLGDGGEVAETAAGGGMAEEGDRHVGLTGKAVVKLYCQCGGSIE